MARIVKQYDIPRANVVGHSDVAPARKIDPGELFPWERLAEYGLCLPRPRKLERGDPFDNDAAFYLALERYGYDVTDGRKAVEAFQRRWRPERIDGEIDGEVRAILFQLLLDRDRGTTRLGSRTQRADLPAKLVRVRLPRRKAASRACAQLPRAHFTPSR